MSKSNPRVAVCSKAYSWLNDLVRMAKEKDKYCQIRKEDLVEHAIFKLTQSDSYGISQAKRNLKSMVKDYLKEDKNLDSPEKLIAILKNETAPPTNTG